MKINIKVKPNSFKQNIEKKDNYYQINLKSEAKQGKANLELIKLLKDYFNCSEIKIKSGFSARKKIVEIID